MELLTCSNLCLGYDGVEILHSVNFTVNEGEYLCIVGENGAGKTLLMKTLLGLQPPVAGKILTGDGFKLSEIGYLPQQSAIQKDFPASVWEIVISGCQNRCGLRPFYSAEEKRIAMNNIEKMGIKDIVNKCYRELSGGQQQRVLLARALCATKKMLLLDEPVTGLDPIATADMYKLFSELHESGITIIMISHDINAAMRYATHILHVAENLFFGTKEEYFNSEVGRNFIKMRAE
jgi:zinc transport system ATP-binding protein